MQALALCELRTQPSQSLSNQECPRLHWLLVKLERLTGVEPASPAWKAEIMTVIRQPLIIKVVTQVGFEPTTNGLEVRCSIQLSYWAMVGLTGFEPATLCSQSRCATKLRHNPMELMIGLEPTIRCLQNSCASIAPHQH